MQKVELGPHSRCENPHLARAACNIEMEVAAAEKFTDNANMVLLLLCQIQRLMTGSIEQLEDKVGSKQT